MCLGYLPWFHGRTLSPWTVSSRSVSSVCMPSCFSQVRHFSTPRIVAHQAPLSMGFSRQEYWSGLPCPPPGKSSQPRDRNFVSCDSCIAGGFFTLSHWGSPYPLFSSVAQLCLTLCNPMECSMPGFPVNHELPELAQTDVH